MCFRFLPVILLLLFSCSQERVTAPYQSSFSQPTEVKRYFIANNGDTIPTGAQLPISQQLIKSSSPLESKTIPLPNDTKIVSAHPYIYPAGKPKVVEQSEEMKVFTPGINGVLIPDTLPAYLNVVPATYSKPQIAAAMQMKDNAVTNIQYLSVEEGLTNNIVQCILEDSRGHLWFGSRDETLTRYDGQSLTFFHNSEDIPDQGFTHLALIEDKNGHIWFGTRTGLCRYDGQNFTYFTNDDSYQYDGVTRLLQDRQGNIWFGTRSRGVGRFDGHSFVHYSSEEGMSHHSVNALLEDSQGNLWFGTNGGGVTQFDGHSFTHLTTDEGLCHNIINAILEDHQGQIWFATQGGGACRYNLKDDEATFTTYTMEEGLSSNMIMGLCEDDEGQIWFGMYFESINLFDGKTFTHFDEKNGMNSTNASTILQDSYGNIWVGTNKGIHRFGLPKFKHYTEALSFSVNDITEDDQGNIWFGVSGSWPNGAIRFDDVSFRFYLGSDEDLDFLNAGIHALTTDQNGNIWFGSGNQGVARFNPDEDPEKLTQFDIGVGGSNFLISMTEDSQGDMWFGTLYGLAHFNGEILTSYLTPAGPGIEYNFAGPFMEDVEHNIWFGHVQYLGKLNAPLNNQDVRNSITYYTKNEGLPHSLVVDIQKDQKGRLWIGTEGGLSKFDGKHFTNFTQEEGLIHRKIYSLVVDSTQRIWAGTQNGLSLLIPSSLEEGDSSGYSIFNFGKEDGLKQADFLYHCSYLDSKNRIWWGKTKGAMMLDLNDFKAPEKPPKIDLDYLEINQQFVDYRRLGDTSYSQTLSFGEVLSHSFDSVAPFHNYPINLNLPSRLNHLTFHFSGIDWAAPHQLRYSYWLEGYDEEWSLPQAEPKAEYRNMPHGHYSLKVKAIGAVHIWSELFEYQFTISPPWWLTWWAYLIYLILGLVSIFGLYQYQRRRWVLQTQLQVEHERADRLKELDRFKSRFYTNITHEFQTPLTVIQGMTDQVEDGKVKTMIQRNAKRLLDMVNQLLDLSKLDGARLSIQWVGGDIIPFLQYLTESCHSLTERKNINLAFFSTENKLVMDYDQEKVQQILLNLLSNAIKFTPAYGSIKVIASRILQNEIPILQLTVSDSGRGIPDDKLARIFDRFYQIDDVESGHVEGSGIGLAIVKELVELLDGQIAVESSPDKGTVFKVFLPIHHQALAEATPKHYQLEDRHNDHVEGGEKDQQRSADHGEKAQILIVEDNLDVCEYVRQCLQPVYQVFTARNGKEGVDKALNQIPDVVISDIMMPEMDGFEVCRILKADRRTSHIPIILLTAKATQDDKNTGLGQGADAYLTKPFNKDELLLRLDNLINISQKLKERLANTVDVIDQIHQHEKKEATFIIDIQNIIKTNMQDPMFDTHQLCRAVAMSRTQLHRKLKALTGQSTASYIRTMRLKNARVLLETTNLPIGEIAMHVGYLDFSHFSRSFAKEYYMKPSDTRK